MPAFTYKAKDRQGQIIAGTLEADTRSAVVSRLQAMGYFPVDIRGTQAAKDATISGKIQKIGTLGGRIKARNLTMFYRQMSDLISAGVPLVKALGVVKSQCPDPALASLISQVDRDVQGGDTFAKALEKHPKVFTKLTSAMIHAGEMGGLLDEVLNRLADFAESEEELGSRIKSALAYPVIMALAGSGAVAVLIIFVIPKIVGIFTEINQTLPLMTQILLAITGFMGDYWWMLLIGIAAGIVSLRRYYRTPVGRRQFDLLFLRVPVIGEIILKREISRFARTFGSLLRNGVPILSALEIANEVMGNVIIQNELAKVPEGIAEGKGISGTLRGSKSFPPVVINMIAIGEETGNLPSVLLKVANTYEGQVDRAVKTLTSIIEPLIILAMGLVIGFIVIAMLLPIFELDPTAG